MGEARRFTLKPGFACLPPKIECYMKSKPTKSPKPVDTRPLATTDNAAAARDTAKNVPRPPKFAGSLVELALILGVTRQTVTRWHKEPGNPGKRSDGRYSVGEWRSFLMNRPHYGGGPDGYREKCRRIRLQCEMLEFEIDELKRKYVKLSDVREWSADLASKIRSVVRGSFTQMAADVRLCSLPESESRLKDAEHTLLVKLNALGNA